jgi:hypothetical protein
VSVYNWFFSKKLQNYFKKRHEARDANEKFVLTNGGSI